MDKLETTGQLLLNACQNLVPKCIALALLYIAQFSFGDLSGSVLFALFILIIFDFITGIWASKMVGERIKSSKIFRTAWKFGLYFTLVSAGHFTEVIIGTNLYIEETIMVFLAVTELISILENTEKAGYNVPTTLLKKLQELIKSK